jgi:glutamyl/glutaminyl-tRNA synthetase
MDADKKLEITKLLKERIKKIGDIETIAKFFWERPEVDTTLFGENYKEHLKSAIEVLEKIDGWNLKNIGDFLLELCDRKEFPRGNFFMSLRIAITGMKFTPPISESIAIQKRVIS